MTPSKEIWLMINSTKSSHGEAYPQFSTVSDTPFGNRVTSYTAHDFVHTHRLC